jgi:hypothetical protein
MHWQAAHLVFLATLVIGTGWAAPEVMHTEELTEPKDSCVYTLSIAKLTKKNREHYRPFLDTTITRSGDCRRHVLMLPARGTVTSYWVIRTESPLDTVANFTFGVLDDQPWDITYAIGEYRVEMKACHMSGEFKLNIR